MRVVFHRDGIISSFEGYEALEEFDWEGYARKYGDIQRFDRILEAEGDSVNRYKASKQADVLMLFYLFSAETLRALFERLGYTGMELRHDALHFNPALPSHLAALKMQIRYRGPFTSHRSAKGRVGR